MTATSTHTPAQRKNANANSSKSLSGSAPEKSVSPAFKYEFGGPIGAIGCMIGLPLTIICLFLACNEDVCLGPDDITTVLQQTQIKHRLFHIQDLGVVTLWFIFQVILERTIPGKTVLGSPLPNQTRLPYKINGHRAFLVTMTMVSIGVFGDILDMTYLYDHYVSLAISSMMFSSALSVYLFISSFSGCTILSAQGQSPNGIYNFFIGRELNPRIGRTFDLKYFFELRPGLIGWVVLNCGMLAKQYERTGSVSMSMAAINVFQLVYVWDAQYNEQSILTTMDITTDGFGFMLAFGDLSWVPFTYSLQARILVDYNPELSFLSTAILCGLCICGYAIFRGANSEKDAFRRDPKSATVAHLRFLPTKRGTKLLISGWWGLARKINYTGDWMMSVAWCALCGTGSIIPYFYAIYFGILLIHRAFRDDEMCEKKYGQDWKTYKKLVPYVFIPKVV